MKFNVHRATKGIHRSSGTRAASRPADPDNQDTDKGRVTAGALIDLRDERRDGEPKAT